MERRSSASNWRLGIPLAVDLVLAVGGVEQVGEVALDDLAHLRTGHGEFAWPLRLTQWRIVAKAIEERGKQLRIGPAWRAGLLMAVFAYRQRCHFEQADIAGIGHPSLLAGSDDPGLANLGPPGFRARRMASPPCSEPG